MSAEESSTEDSGEDQFNINEVRKAWPTILSQIKKEDIQTQAYLIEGKPIEVKENTVYIEFSKKKRFHKKGAQKRKKLISRIFNRVLSRNCSLRFIIEGEAPGNNPEKRNESFESDNSSNQSSSGENLVNEVADLFDGEVIKADENFLDD